MAPDHPERIKFEKLLAMLDAPGADYTKTEMKFYGENQRGVHAKTGIKKGDTLMKVPYEKLVSEDIVRKTPIGKGILDNPALRSGLHFKHNNHLAAYILQEKEKPLDEQAFGPYIELLPDKFDEFPINFNAEDLTYLKET